MTKDKEHKFLVTRAFVYQIRKSAIAFSTPKGKSN